MKNICNSVLFAAVAAVGVVSCDKKDAQEAHEAWSRAKVVAEETVDSALSALEERVGLSRIAIRHWDKEKKRRREAVVNIKAKQKELERLVEEESSAVTADPDNAERHKNRAEVFRVQLQQAKEVSAKAETNYKKFCSDLEQRKEELQLVEMKLEVLKAELDAMGKGDASEHAARARQIEEELKQACDKLEAQIELEE